MKINKLFESFALTQMLNTITQKKFLVKVGTLIYDCLLPLISVTIIFNVIICVGWFIFWSMPEHFYIPFTGGEIQGYFDRVLVGIGIVMRISSTKLYK